MQSEPVEVAVDIAEAVDASLARTGTSRKSDAEAIEGAELLAPASVRAYQAAWRDFTAWCQQQGESALPTGPGTLTRYLTARAETIKIATLTKRLAAIAHYHAVGGFESPTRADAVRRQLRILKRKHGAARTQKAALTTDELIDAVVALPDTLIGKRDRALLLLGFAGAFRRSEIVALDAEDVAKSRRGLVVTLRQSKTDQEGKGRPVGIPFGRDADVCPVKALENWLESANITTGPLFRAIDRHGNVAEAHLCAYTVSLILKAAVDRIGLDAVKFGGHSLRAGLVTSAYLGGADDRTIMRQTGHTKRETVDVYVRDADLFRDNAATRAGL